MSDDDLSGLPPAEPPDTGSLEDHEAAFGPNGTGVGVEEERTEQAVTAPEAGGDKATEAAPRDEQGKFTKTPRHRAKSQQASPDDVPRIRELTAKLRAAEERAAELERRPPAAPPQQAPPPPQPRQDAPPPQAWTPPATRPKPSEDEIGEKYKTYADFTEDLSEWIGEQRDAKRDARLQQETRQKTYQEWTTQYTTALADARTRYADYDTQVAQADAMTAAQQIVLPQVLQDAILSSPRGPDLTYYLATHPDEYRELIRDAWQVNHPNSIGLVRKVLESRLPPVAAPQRPMGSGAAVGTGSAPRSPQLVPAPRPPNPVRTGHQKIGDDPPDDDSSLDAHEAHYYKRR